MAQWLVVLIFLFKTKMHKPLGRFSLSFKNRAIWHLSFSTSPCQNLSGPSQRREINQKNKLNEKKNQYQSTVTKICIETVEEIMQCHWFHWEVQFDWHLHHAVFSFNKTSEYLGSN